MISHLAILPAARSDLLFQAEYYDANGGTQLGDRFLAKCEAAFDRLKAFPESGTSVRYQHSRLAGCRFVLVPSFEAILIFYRPSPDQIEIVRVIHSARDLETALVDKDES